MHENINCCCYRTSFLLTLVCYKTAPLMSELQHVKIVFVYPLRFRAARNRGRKCVSGAWTITSILIVMRLWCPFSLIAFVFSFFLPYVGSLLNSVSSFWGHHQIGTESSLFQLVIIKDTFDNFVVRPSCGRNPRVDSTETLTCRRPPTADRRPACFMIMAEKRAKLYW